jgi:predicted nucleotidyltransferase
VAYALLFGSTARNTRSATSDIDVAIGVVPGVRLTALEIGELTARLEGVAGRTVDLVIADEAPPAISYRVFRDGCVISMRDRPAFVRAKARAILEYLDFKPIHDLCIRGAIEAAARGR